jgi:hypothetical protein
MLNRDEILRRTNNGLDVFKHYIPGTWRIGRNFLNPLRLKIIFREIIQYRECCGTLRPQPVPRL